jgi:hypothetical protein
MKKIYLLALMATAILHSGCASERNPVVLDAVGPAQPAKPDPATADQGTLVVYSAVDPTPHFGARDPFRPVYSNYEIYSPDGRLLEKIHNNDDTMLQRPVGVGLPAGKYTVQARANGNGLVSVPVIIQAGQNTVLHLEGGANFGNRPASDTNVVRLPDGQIVGWRASL